MDDVKFPLSGKFSQHPLENYIFGGKECVVDIQNLHYIDNVYVFFWDVWKLWYCLLQQVILYFFQKKLGLRATDPRED